MKRASITVSQIIWIALFIFIIVIIAVSVWGNDLIFWIQNFGGDFRQTSATIAEIQIIGYNIGQNAMKYYDGNNWYNPEKDLVYKDKTLNNYRVQQTFLSFFILGARSENLQLSFDQATQTEIRQWYEGAGTWNVIASAAPFQAIISPIIDINTKEVRVEVTSTRYNNEISSNPQREGLTLARPKTLDGYSVNVLYQDGKETGLFIITPTKNRAPTYEERSGKLYAWVADPQKGIFSDDNVAVVGYLEPDATGNYRVKIYSNLYKDLARPVSEKKGGLIEAFSSFSFNGGKFIADETYNLLVNMRQQTLYYENMLREHIKDEYDPERYGYFYLTLQNRLEFEKVDENLNREGKRSTLSQQSSFYRTIAPQAIAWRDSVLKNPINIEYTDRTTNRPITDKWFCLTKVVQGETVLLTADLTKPVSQSTPCQ